METQKDNLFPEKVLSTFKRLPLKNDFCSDETVLLIYLINKHGKILRCWPCRDVPWEGIFLKGCKYPKTKEDEQQDIVLPKCSETKQLSCNPIQIFSEEENNRPYYYFFKGEPEHADVTIYVPGKRSIAMVSKSKRITNPVLVRVGDVYICFCQTNIKGAIS